MQRFRNLFDATGRCAVIGMVHVAATPGTPGYKGSVDRIVEEAVKEALIYKRCHVDSILIENMHDVPYVRPKDLTPDTVATMTRICTEIVSAVGRTIPCGVQVCNLYVNCLICDADMKEIDYEMQILAGCNKEALAVAKAANLRYIRAEGFVFSHVADEGFTDACAGPLLRYQKHIDGGDILILADIKKKHSAHAITTDVSLADTVKAAEFFLADGVILTGTATGDPVNVSDLQEVKQVATIPVLIGSGATANNIPDYLSADALIVGSHFKVDGNWKNGVDEKRVLGFVSTLLASS